jgi:hypothetical protein
MEISKEKFIQLFQDECSRAVDEKKYGAFIVQDTIWEIECNKTISFTINESLIEKRENDNDVFQHTGQIIFNSLVLYKEFPLTEREFLELHDYYTKCQFELEKRQRQSIVYDGEKALEAMI